ncbi:uncharacterized protein PV07_00698 [Cladophialophora immunda]|uniref:Alcohol dehydrogenase-like C-terminal domain-containing protein n=1 Tax=Cladophialophora immunda TaxID=569365 RepID=A0A0D2CRR8_9EURO|nr:uncharacterized protein PV07_00698 [Cladophialophora immunda]KIW33883.1 hypothetical protein PV07_00698 [Cladophialophora immunda]
MFDTMNQAMPCLSLMRKGGFIVSISGTAFGSGLKQKMPTIPLLVRCILSTLGTIILWRCWRFGVSYSHCFMEPSRKDLSRLSGWVDEGKLKPVVGKAIGLDDLDGIRQGCGEVYRGKGGLGKFVIRVHVTEDVQ